MPCQAVKFKIGIAIVLFSSVVAAGQIRTFKWSDELCEYSGNYNSRKYSADQIRNTHRLLQAEAFSLESVPMVFKPADIDRLDIAKLDEEYSRKTAELRTLNIVREPYWLRLRTQMLEQMRQVYEMSRAATLGYRSPAKLLEYDRSPSCNASYAEPLVAGGDDLLAAWESLNTESRQRNSDPERVRRVFESQRASPDRVKFATVELITFGWWNCVNETIPYDSNDGTNEREFKKLFIRVTRLACDEP